MGLSCFNLVRLRDGLFASDMLDREAIGWNTAPDVLTVREAAALARVSRNAMYEAVHLGLVPSTNFGLRRIRIAKSELAKVFQSHGEIRRLTAAFNHLPEA